MRKTGWEKENQVCIKCQIKDRGPFAIFMQIKSKEWIFPSLIGIFVNPCDKNNTIPFILQFILLYSSFLFDRVYIDADQRKLQTSV